MLPRTKTDQVGPYKIGLMGPILMSKLVWGHHCPTRSVVKQARKDRHRDRRTDRQKVKLTT